MKIEQKIKISASPENTWKALIDLSAHSRYNAHIQFKGNPVFEAPLEIKTFSAPVRLTRAVVTGVSAPKYFSISSMSGIGAWWFHAEHVFRIIPQSGDTADFIHETFCHGLRTRFANEGIRGWLLKGMIAFNSGLKTSAESLSA